MKRKQKTTGIAFGGGGTRGITHLGAIRVFQEYGVDFDYVAGNSAGALAGALYADGIPWREIYDFVLNIKGAIPRKTMISYMSPEIIENLADNFFKGKRFSDLKKPFCVVAVDLERGKLETLCRGNLSKALSASCAVPGVFQPVKIGAKTYIDGGTLRSIPTEAVREMGAGKVVGIDLNSDRLRGTSSTKRLNVLATAYNLSISVNSHICEQYADIMLKPWLESYPRHSLKSIGSMLKIGEKTALENLAEIKELLK